MAKRPMWNEDKTSGAMLGAGVAAALLLIGGSYWPGWQLNSTAQQNVVNGQKTALVRVLAPVCSERFKIQPNLVVQTAALKKVESWNRDRYLVDNKWVIPSGVSSEVDVAVGNACADMLADLTK